MTHSPLIPAKAGIQAGSPLSRGRAVLGIALALLALLAAIWPARAADDVASFYRGKQIRFIVGSAPGGTYDLLARIVARHIGAYIPGKPLIIVQNQPTAGGIAMTNQLYALGPRDGTVIGVPLNGIPAAPLLQPQAAHFESAKLIWVGSTHSEPYVAYVWRTAPVHELADVLTKPLVVGATTPGTTMNDFPLLANAVLGSKFKFADIKGATYRRDGAKILVNPESPSWVAAWS